MHRLLVISFNCGIKKSEAINIKYMFLSKYMMLSFDGLRTRKHVNVLKKKKKHKNIVKLAPRATSGGLAYGTPKWPGTSLPCEPRAIASLYQVSPSSPPLVGLEEVHVNTGKPDRQSLTIVFSTTH